MLWKVSRCEDPQLPRSTLPSSRGWGQTDRIEAIYCGGNFDVSSGAMLMYLLEKSAVTPTGRQDISEVLGCNKSHPGLSLLSLQDRQIANG